MKREWLCLMSASLTLAVSLSFSVCSLLRTYFSLPRSLQRIWGNTKLNYFRQNFMRQRKRAVSKRQNPRMERRTLHTLRHLYGITECHKTKDSLYVQERLGHRSILSTMLYTHRVRFESDEYHVKVAKT